MIAQKYIVVYRKLKSIKTMNHLNKKFNNQKANLRYKIKNWKP